jgi:hypothetical protein
MTINSFRLSKMEMKWSDLPSPVQSTLDSTLVATMVECNLEDFVSLLRSCVVLGYNWSNPNLNSGLLGC